MNVWVFVFWYLLCGLSLRFGLKFSHIERIKIIHELIKQAYAEKA